MQLGCALSSVELRRLRESLGDWGAKGCVAHLVRDEDDGGVGGKVVQPLDRVDEDQVAVVTRLLVRPELAL